jgi:hypothetical protein
VAITITGGEAVVKEATEHYKLPKRDLVSTMRVPLQTGWQRQGPTLPEAAMLVQELLAFQVKIIPQDHDTYGTQREGGYDDPVLAVALTCWYGEQGRRRQPNSAPIM